MDVHRFAEVRVNWTVGAINNFSSMNDLSRQSRTPISIVSVDASQCYDRVNHVITSLVWLALVGVVGPAKVLLHCLQTVKLFQRTGHGGSSTFTRGKGFYFMGMGQSSRGAPPSWICPSSVIVGILRKLKHGTRIIDLMTRSLIHSVGAMFVDDSDLYCQVKYMQSAEKLYKTIQAETKMWRDLLLATRGCLKPEKMFLVHARLHMNVVRESGFLGSLSTGS